MLQVNQKQFNAEILKQLINLKKKLFLQATF